ncbi:LysR family transcriptional regulator [Bordetella tumulicola]|uniref:LysR family transcriptional regulator n=1 Tax=Bordetella tumulicola TaxID=1649133 RepID=UPI0039F0E7F5
MDMRQLRYFVTVAEELSFRRAAERLHISQPPLSLHIKTLEDEIGVQLLHRTRREVKLTESGQAFLRETRVLLDQMQLAVNAAVRAEQSDVGVLRVGLATSALFHVMSQVKRLIETRFPQVTLSMVDMASADQVKEVSLGLLDLGIVHARSVRSEVQRQLIYQEPLVAVLPSQHALAHTPGFKLAMLADEPMVALRRDCGPAIYDSIVACCHEAGFSPDIKHIARSPLTIFQMVKLGLGVSIAPASYANTGFSGVIFREFPQTAGQVRLEMIWSDKHASDLTRRVVSDVVPRLAIGTTP